MTELPEKNLSIFERYLSVWVVLCIGGGIFLGKIAPSVATTLNDFSFYQVSIPIAVCLFFMMYPIMVKIDFAQVLKSAKTPKLLQYVSPGATIPPSAAKWMAVNYANIETQFVGYGRHFIQEDNPESIGRGIVDWYRRNFD